MPDRTLDISRTPTSTTSICEAEDALRRLVRLMGAAYAQEFAAVSDDNAEASADILATSPSPTAVLPQ